MKAINLYINEKLIIGNNLYDGYNYQPKDKKELIACIDKKIEKEGLGTENKPLDLNDIDTSKITDMSNLFDALNGRLKKLSYEGYFNISNWNVSNVKNMRHMFYNSNFNGDISLWNVYNVKDMSGMFCASKFNRDISLWNVKNVETMFTMFNNSKFNGDISKWNVSNVKNMEYMFTWCPLENNPPKWYKR